MSSEDEALCILENEADLSSHRSTREEACGLLQPICCDLKLDSGRRHSPVKVFQCDLDMLP
jgi:hypothetical protein